jgi:hypothetical protein
MASGVKVQGHAFGRQQGLILLDQAGRGLGQDGFEVAHRQGGQLHADREAPLQFRDQVAGLAQVERA